jgi:hypothetical protein
MSPRSLAVPILIIAVGVGWMLTVHHVLPGVNWIWLLMLAIAGVLVIIVGGPDKVTLVIGPFLIIATMFSLLRQTGRISIDSEVPALVILLGVLMLLVRLLPVPAPKWFTDQPIKPTPPQ